MLQLRDIVHRYPGAAPLSLPDIQLEPGEQALLLGPSGSGKSTLLHIAAGLLTAQSGEVRLGDTDLAGLSGAARDRFRGRQIGIVFQKLHLIPSLTVMQNLLAARFSAGLPQDRSTLLTLLERLGLGIKADSMPASLSQGQVQRVAIALALVNRPQLIVADEPTSSLDDANASAVLDLLRDQARDCGAMLLIATHDARTRGAIPRHIEVAAPLLRSAA